MENRISKEKALMHWLIINFVIFVLALASTTIYIFNETTYVVPEPWRDAIISKWNVEKKDLLGDESLSKLGLLNMITPIGLLGSILGIISYSHFAPNHVNHLDFLPFKLTWARFVLNIIICSPIATLFLLSKWFPFVTRVVIWYFLSQFMYSFMVFGPNRYIFLKLGLVHESNVSYHEPVNKFEEEKEE